MADAASINSNIVFTYDEERQMNMKDFFTEYQHNLPQLVIITEGCSTGDCEDVSSDDVYWVHTYSQQPRVLAEDGGDSYLSIPIKTDTRYFVVGQSGVEDRAKTLDTILKENKELSITIQHTNITKPRLTLCGIHKETYLVGNCLQGNSRSLLGSQVTTALSTDIQCATVIGIKDRSEAEFQDYLQQLTNSVKDFLFDTSAGSRQTKRVPKAEGEDGGGLTNRGSSYCVFEGYPEEHWYTELVDSNSSLDVVDVEYTCVNQTDEEKQENHSQTTRIPDSSLVHELNDQKPLLQRNAAKKLSDSDLEDKLKTTSQVLDLPPQKDAERTGNNIVDEKLGAFIQRLPSQNSAYKLFRHNVPADLKKDTEIESPQESVHELDQHCVHDNQEFRLQPSVMPLRKAEKRMDEDDIHGNKQTLQQPPPVPPRKLTQKSDTPNIQERQEASSPKPMLPPRKTTQSLDEFGIQKSREIGKLSTISTSFSTEEKEKDQLQSTKKQGPQLSNGPSLQCVSVTVLSSHLGELGLRKKVIKKFEKNKIDGTTLHNPSFTDDILKTEYGLTPTELVKLRQYIDKGHIPK